MMKERMMAIVIGGLMLLSVGGFAIMGLNRFAGTGDQQVQIPTIMNEYLSGEQMSQILRSGRVLIRDVYTTGCSECMSNDATLEMFANGFSGIVVLEEVMIEPDNTTSVDESGYVKFEMISPTGDIVDLRGRELTQDSLTDVFCEISAVQPRECLLRGITNNVPPAGNAGNDISDGLDGAGNETGMNGTAMDGTGPGLNGTATNSSMNVSNSSGNAS